MTGIRVAYDSVRGETRGWEIILEPGAVFVVESDELAVELQIERYEFAEGSWRCVLASVSEKNADAGAPRIWAEMQDTLNRSKLPEPLPPRRLP